MDITWKNFLKKKAMDNDGYFERPRQDQWQEWGEYVLVRYVDPLPTAAESF